MTPEQLLQEAEKLLDEANDASDDGVDVIYQGWHISPSDARPVIEYMVELIREFVVAQTKVAKRT